MSRRRSNRPGAGRTENRNGESPRFRIVDRRHGRSGEEADPQAGSTSELPTFVEELRGRAEEAERRLHEYIAAYKEERREMESVRARLRGEAEERARQVVGRSFGEILGIVENLDRALSHAEEGNPLSEGVRQTRDLLLALLERQGLEPIVPLGEPFDPHESEALLTRPVDEERDGRVVEVARPGFRFDGKVLRPAQVVVGRHEKAPAD